MTSNQESSSNSRILSNRMKDENEKMLKMKSAQDTKINAVKNEKLKARTKGVVDNSFRKSDTIKQSIKSTDKEPQYDKEKSQESLLTENTMTDVSKNKETPKTGQSSIISDKNEESIKTTFKSIPKKETLTFEKLALQSKQLSENKGKKNITKAENFNFDNLSFTEYRDSKQSKKDNLKESTFLSFEKLAFHAKHIENKQEKNINKPDSHDGKLKNDSFLKYRDAVPSVEKSKPFKLEQKSNDLYSKMNLEELQQNLKKNKALLKHSRALPDGGQKIKNSIEEIEVILGKLTIKESQEMPPQPADAAPRSAPATVTCTAGIQFLVEPPPLTTSAYKELYKKPAKDESSSFKPPPSKTHLNQVLGTTLESLEKLEKARPDPSESRAAPRGLKTELLPHQGQALHWLLWREKQTPAGGILADDMGLGKTLTAISLVLKSKERHRAKLSGSAPGRRPTLVVCPASLVHQWAQQVDTHCHPDRLSVCVYHGSKRDPDPDRLAQHDMVITTYSLVGKEVPEARVSQGLGAVQWYRVMLDEGHTIKNPKSQVSQASCRLAAHKRWILTGTPIHNNISDFFSLIKFLRYEPFCDPNIWKAWILKDFMGTKLIESLVKVLILRRTKPEKNSTGQPLVALPKKTVKVTKLQLSGLEREVYSVLDHLCKDTLKNYLRRLALKSHSYGQEIKYSSLLVLLLRLQQCCCHLHLLQQTADALEDSQLEEDSLSSKLSALSLEEPSLGLGRFASAPELEMGAGSSKLDALLVELGEIRTRTPPENCVVVSQWTGYLDIIAHHLQRRGLHTLRIQGNMPPAARTEAVDKFNAGSDQMQVMLVSLKAGGVGLNLVGGCHLFLMDLHWNPALEAQASDRVHRVGQVRDVTVHKFVMAGTVEERIARLQQQKLQLADSVLTTAREANKIQLGQLQDLLQSEDDT